MRVAGGSLRGRTLHAPAGRVTRPTSDRVREAIFNVLTHGLDDVQIEGARVLDLFAGSGALGLEALSRGARFALFIDEAAAARGAIRRNAEELGVLGRIKIWRRDATRLGPCAPLPRFDLAFIDPPYGRGLGEAAAARGAIRRNAEDLGVLGRIKIWRRDATRLGPCAPLPRFDLAFIDPPYGRGLGEAALASLHAGAWLAADAVVVLEEAERAPVAVPEGFTVVDQRSYGDTQVLFLRDCH